MAKINNVTDDALADAVRRSRSWRGVLRALALPETHSRLLLAVRERSEALAMDTSHFTGGRRWSDEQLRDAIATCESWSTVTRRLGLSNTGGGTANALRRHAARLGLQTAHLQRQRVEEPQAFRMEADSAYLRRAGAMLAAAWFMLRGYEIVWPLEPCRYDFLVDVGAAFFRVQVKTTTCRAGSSRPVSISATRRRGRVCYTADEIDYFFVLDGELNAYLIPIASVEGRQQLDLAAYRARIVAEHGQWLTAPAAQGQSLATSTPLACFTVN